MASLDNLPSNFADFPVRVQLSREDGIGYVTLTSLHDELLSFRLVEQMTRALRDRVSVPVHFHRLEGDAVMFFVFDTEQCRRKLGDYGTPVLEWLTALTGPAGAA